VKKSFFFFITFFLILFIQFPITESLPGNSTSWLALAISNSYSHFFSQLISGEELTSFFYPLKNIFSYGQGAPIPAILFLIFKTIGFNDLWSYYFFLTLIFSLSAWAISLLAYEYTKSKVPSVFAGFAFTIGNFIFANIDDPHEIFFFFPVLSLLFLKKFKEQGVKKHFYLAMLLGGIQIYCSFYIFVFQTIYILGDFLILGRRWKTRDFKTLLGGTLIYHFLIFPVIAFHLYALLKLKIINPFDSMAVIKSCSLMLKDFFAPMEGNILYGGRSQGIEEPLFWSFIRRHAFTGVLFFGLGIIGLANNFKKYSELILLAALGLFIALGPQWVLTENIKFTSPLTFFYEYIPLSLFLRVPLRAFFFTILSLTIGAAFTLKRFERKLSRPIIAILFIFHFLENCPVPLKAFNATYIEPPSAYLSYFAEKKGRVIIDLPTNLGVAFQNSHRDLFPYNREMIYMNWQTKHKQNILGGAHGYWPKSRVELQKLIDELPAKESFLRLKSLGVTDFIFHKKMVLEEESHLLKILKESANLSLVHEDELIAIFNWNS